ncbi:MAG TPA: hypothetical protein VKA66_18580 [Mycobacterium sp.]|nr:hypothetical protein [Mycobacterium sp.]
MSALAGFPGLSQLLTWPTEHLTDTADHWEAVGGRSYAVTNQIWRDAQSIDWRGEAADALRTTAHADMLTTSAVADQLHDAARVARSGASDLYAARSRVRYAVEDARAAGFQVGDDLSITTSAVDPPAQWAAREAQAQDLPVIFGGAPPNWWASISRWPARSPQPKANSPHGERASPIRGSTVGYPALKRLTPAFSVTRPGRKHRPSLKAPQ